MSMITCLHALPESLLRVVMEDPRTVSQILAPDDLDAQSEHERYSQPSAAGSLWKWIKRLISPEVPPLAKPTPATVPRLTMDPSTVRSTDLDKAWHGIHFLLTGTAEGGTPPLNFLMVGGTPIGTEHWGYDVPRAFSSQEVQDIAQALNAISPDDLDSRFQPTEMTRLDIYPSIWDRPPHEDDTLGYCKEYFRELRQFIDQAATRQDSLIITIE